MLSLLAATMAGQPVPKSPATESWCASAARPPLVGMYGPDMSAPLLRVRPTGAPMVDGLFAQGLAQEWNFNDRESLRNFQTAADLAPDCAICWWGVARALSSNINRQIMDFVAFNASVERAERALKPTDSQKVRDLVRTIGLLRTPVEHVVPGIMPMGPDAPLIWAGRMAYAEAVCALGEEDADLSALCADATMATSPWNYYENMRLSQGPGPLKSAFEPVLARLLRLTAPAAGPHALAQHLLIHLSEPRTGEYVHAMLGQDAADGLVQRYPGAGHLQHMPAHLYLRTGAYEAGVEASRLAAVANNDYLDRCLCPYVPAHNLYMGIWHALLLGNSAAALELAQVNMAQAAKYDVMPAGANCMRFDGFAGASKRGGWRSLVLTRFGRWAELVKLGHPAPCEAAKGPACTNERYMQLFAHGMAAEATGDVAHAEAIFDELQALAGFSADSGMDMLANPFDFTGTFPVPSLYLPCTFPVPSLCHPFDFTVLRYTSVLELAAR